MKKRLSRCEDCGEENSILTQVSSGPEVVFLCSECYNLKNSKEIQKEIRYDKEEKSQNREKLKKKYLVFMGWENLTILSLNFFALVFVFRDQKMLN